MPNETAVPDLTPDEAKVLKACPKWAPRQKIMCAFDGEVSIIRVVMDIEKLVSCGLLSVAEIPDWNGVIKYRTTETGRAALAAFEAKTR